MPGDIWSFFLRVYIYAYVYIYACVYMCVYIYGDLLSYIFNILFCNFFNLKCFYSDTFIACILITLMGVGNTKYRWPEEGVRFFHSGSCAQPAINC